MRAPLSAIVPFRRGVSMAVRGEAASTASRVCVCTPAGVAVPGTLSEPGGAVAPGAGVVPGGPGAGGAPGGGGGAGRRLALLRLLDQRLLLLPLHLRPADEELPADQHERRQHDGDDGVFIVHLRLLLPPPARFAPGASSRLRIRR